MVDKHQLLRDAYEGTGGFEDGTYLKKHGRETDEGYADRRELGYFLNYTAPTVNSHVDPVFGVPAKRDWKSENELWHRFREDADGSGTPLEGVMKRAGLVAKLHGAAFVLVDNYAEQPPTEAEAAKARILPYAGVIVPARVKGFGVDRTGKLTSFKYLEPADPENIGASSWDPATMNTREWTKTEWIVRGSDGKVVAHGEHGLGRVPIARLYPRKVDPADVLPQSEFYSIARTNLAIFNHCSWMTEILRNQAFSILVYPSEEAKDLTIGTNNALGFDGVESHHAPAFIAPDAAPAAMIAEQLDRLIQEIYRMARLSHVTGTQEASSGVAKAWDFQTTNQVLADFAANCGDAEADVVAIFEAWTGQVTGYTVEYPREFQVDDVAEVLDNAGKAIDLGFGGDFDIEVCKKVLAVMFPDLDDATFDAIIAAVKTLKAQDAYNMDVDRDKDDEDAED